MSEIIRPGFKPSTTTIQEQAQKHADPMYLDSWVGRINKGDLTKVADAVNNIPMGRSVEPHPYTLGPRYEHRDLFSKDFGTYLRIGDSIMSIPPSFIGVFDRSSSEQIGAMRQSGTVKVNQGYSNREITIHLFFNGFEQINGYEVDGPLDESYYVDGLRPLLAQFKLCPFLPIENELLNGGHGIYAVALSSISIENVEGFPGCLEAVLNLMEFDFSSYTQVPSIFFDNFIDWDLHRYYYQRLLTPSKTCDVYLPPLNKALNGNEEFSISVLCPSNLMSKESKQLDDLSDDKYYDTFVSDSDAVALTNVNFGLANLFPSIQLEGQTRPALQYMGGTDARVNLAFETMDRGVLAKFEDLKASSQYASRNYRNLNQIGFIKIKNELVNLTGTCFYVLEEMQSTTVPEFPGLHRITLSLIGFDIGQRKASGLHQISPVKQKGQKSDAISQDVVGVYTKAIQDNEVERQMMDHLSLYPDLCLPTLKELDEIILKINAYRKSHQLELLKYGSYPREESIRPGGDSDDYYNGYADPDFYVFYPMRYSDLDEETVGECYNEPKQVPTNTTIPDTDYGEEFVQDSRLEMLDPTLTSSYYGVTNTPDGRSNVNVFTPTGSTSRDDFVNLLLEQEGSGYVYGATGQIHTEALSAQLKKEHPEHTGYGISLKWLGVRSFDCSGFIDWGMWQLGNWKGARGDGLRFTSHNMLTNTSYFKRITESELIPGDICHTDGHVGVYIGKDSSGHLRTIEAMNPKDGVCKGYVADNNKRYFENFSRPLVFDGAGGDYSTNNWNNVKYPTKQANLDIGGGSTSGIRNDMQFDSRVSITALNVHLIKGLSGMGQQFRDAAQKHNVDPALLAAISKLESGHGTSSNFRNHNNPSGTMDPASDWKRPVTFPSVQAGLEYTAKNLSNNYIAQGRTTIQTIGDKYCPIGAANDPNGTNKNWVPTVTKFYNEIKATAYNMSPSDIGNAPRSVDVNGTVITDDGYRTSPVTPSFGYVRVQAPYEYKQTEAGETIQDKAYEMKYKAPTQKVIKSQSQSDKNSRIQSRAFIEDAASSEAVGVYEARNFARPHTQTTPLIQSLTGENLTDESGVFDNASYHGKKGDDVNEGKLTAAKALASDLKKEELEQGFIDATIGEHLAEQMMVDMVTFEKRGRLLRAFPTFAFMMVDDGGEWLDGRKLWSNFYLYRSVLEIKVFQESSQPIQTAVITVNDAYDRLDKYPSYSEQLYRKTFMENDEEYLRVVRWWYEWTGSLLGGPKLTQNMMDLKNVLHNTIKLQAGCRLHIRAGFGSNPINLPILFNGMIAEINHADGVVEMVAQSHGQELLSTTVSSKENETNSFFKFQSEPSNIIASILMERKGKFANMINKSWGEPNEYGIESFGINFAGWKGNTKQSHQRDLLKNVFVGKYEPQYMTQRSFANFDGEKNFNFALYGKYPWDCMQMCAQFLPEFVCQPVHHQFESRIFYGLPFFPYRYRYDVGQKGKLETWTESSKPYAQFHMVDSSTDIVRNKIKASSKGLKTNVIALYTLGSNSDETPVLYSDRTLDWSKQATAIVDTTTIQDYIGPDKFYERVGLNTGKSAAIKIGLSNLTDGWNKTYKGELVLTGNPSIKPHDYLYINDTHKEIKGLVTVRSVIHSISGQTGMTTSVVPNLITTANTHYSGAANVIRTLMSYGQGLGSVYNIKDSSKAYIDYNMSVFASLKIATAMTSWALSTAAFDVASTLSVNSWAKVMAGFKKGTVVTKSADFFVGIAKSYEAYDKATDLWKVAQGSKAGIQAAKAIKTSVSIGKAGALVASNVVPVVGPIITSIVIDVALNGIIEAVSNYFAYKNCISIYPLVKSGHPFSVSTRGAKYLIPGATSTPYGNNDTEEESDSEEIEV